MQQGIDYRVVTPAPQSVLPWQKVGGRRTLYQGRGIGAVQQDFINPKTGKQEPFDIITKVDGSVILVLTRGGNLVLVQQYKQAKDVVTTEFPAGLSREGKDPLELALTELENETGYRPEEVHELCGGGAFLAARKLDTEEYSFVALGCQRVKDPSPDKGEILQVIEMTQQSFWRAAALGEIRSANTLITAMKALLHGYLDLRYVSQQFLQAHRRKSLAGVVKT